LPVPGQIRPSSKEKPYGTSMNQKADALLTRRGKPTEPPVLARILTGRNRFVKTLRDDS